MERVKKLHVHLTQASSARDEERKAMAPVLPNWRLKLDEWKSSLEHELPAEGEYNIADHLPGPLRDTAKYPSWLDAFKPFEQAQAMGQPHVQIAAWQKEYGGSMSSNIVIPYLIFKREDGDEGKRMPPVVTQEVIIADPEDARRVARVHVKKQPNFNLVFYGSVISTTDNEYWRQQREQLVPGFLPDASLRQIFDISADRAQFSADRLASLAQEGGGVVDLNDFLLHETQAQLQLALFGESQEFMEETNDKFRNAMGGSHDPGYVRPFCKHLAERMDDEERTGPAIMEDVRAGKCPMARGPLSQRLRTMEGVAPRTREGNSLIFAFAGHDTTGHTMTWLLFELAKNPELQRRLQAEVDSFFAEQGDRKVEYADLRRLPFMTRCVMETLRLWPAVANGTYREIQFDDYIKGPGGKQVLIKKGTYVRIVNWSRHRNPELWGADVDEFNPDREFRDAEIWHGEPLKAYNPATDRFSPFTFPPRGCIGMNFAHMEIRLIIAHLLHRFSFELTPEFLAKYDPSTYLGVNYGTMGPQNLHEPPMVKGFSGWAPKSKVPTGMPMRVVPRTG